MRRDTHRGRLALLSLFLVAVGVGIGVLLSVPRGDDYRLAMHVRDSGEAKSVLRGRGQELASIHVLLGSLELADVAWGAYYAGTLKIQQAVPSLVDALERVRKDASDGSRVLVEAALIGSLIELDARVPIRCLEPHAQGTHALLRQGRAVLALRLGDEELLSYWKYAGDLQSVEGRGMAAALLRRGAPGFVRSLLDEVELRLVIVVVDKSAEEFGEDTRLPRGGVPGSFRTSIPREWPPIPVPTWHEEPLDGAVVIVGGAPAFHLVMRYSEQGEVRFGRVASAVFGPHGAALELFRSLDGVEVPSLHRRVGLALAAEEDFGQRVTREVRAMGDQFWTLVRLLNERGLLSLEEAADLVVRCEITTQDHRSSPSGGVPDLPKVRLENPFG